LAAQGGNKYPHAAFDRTDLEDTGLNHVFLGHYHESCEDALFTYPGNPHPLSFGESSKGHRGAVVATITDQGTVYREWRPVSNFPFHDVQLDVTGCFMPDDVKQRLKQSVRNLQGVARVTLSGEVPAELDFNLKELSDIGHSMEALLLRIGKVHPIFDFQ